MTELSIETTSAGCYRVEMEVDGSARDWSQKFLLRSDAHHDNAHSNWRLEALHLEQAVESGAGILDIGDAFCAMQGKYDRRSDLSQCRPEHQQGRYLDSLVETAADFYEPYAKNWLMCSPGNHEKSITKYHETDLTERLCERLRAEGSNVVCGTYAGFIRFVARFSDGKTISRVMYYHHGHGGGGLMTHGVLNTRRRQSYLPDSDIVWSGHTHDSWIVRLSKANLSRHGRVAISDVVHISTPGYKDEFTPMDGWHIERGAPPKPLGACWLNFSIDQTGHDRKLRIDAAEAK